jgi:hypothetical protein
MNVLKAILRRFSTPKSHYPVHRARREADYIIVLIIFYLVHGSYRRSQKSLKLQRFSRKAPSGAFFVWARGNTWGNNGASGIAQMPSKKKYAHRTRVDPVALPHPEPSNAKNPRQHSLAGVGRIGNFYLGAVQNELAVGRSRAGRSAISLAGQCRGDGYLARSSACSKDSTATGWHQTCVAAMCLARTSAK